MRYCFTYDVYGISDYCLDWFYEIRYMIFHGFYESVGMNHFVMTVRIST